MASKFLPEEQLPAFLGYLAQTARVVVPVSTDGVVGFEPWAEGKKVELDVLLAKQSPKEWIFPQTETYLRFKYRMEMPGDSVGEPATAGASSAEACSGAPDQRTGHGEAAAGEVAAGEVADPGEAADPAEPVLPYEMVDVEVVEEAPAQVIFGLRPCDARGFVQMDRVFSGYGGFYFDPLYNARRVATTLLAVTCRDPRSTCFCTALGGAPGGLEGVDALFTQVEGGFTVEAFTEKGEAATAFTGLSAATEAQTAEATEVKAQAAGKIDVPFSLEGLRDHLHDNIDDPRWHDLCMRCISCGTCTYVCPSCYCFSINDEIVEIKGERYRVWDNCFNPVYTEETSGHNPRAHKANRFRNRFSHKFWYYPDKYDSLLCSGCGRCIMHCPTHIDIREVLRTMSGPASDAAGAGRGAASDARPVETAQEANARGASAAAEGAGGAPETAAPETATPGDAPAAAEGKEA